MTRDVDHLLPSSEPVTLIDAHGNAQVSERHAMPETGELVRAMGGLMTARRLNDQAYALVRQGRLAVYPSSHGQEACQVAAAQVLAEDDWLFPTPLPSWRAAWTLSAYSPCSRATGTPATTPTSATSRPKPPRSPPN